MNPTRARQRICVFCGSSKGRNGRYLTAAGEVGRALTLRGFGVVYGGGNVGLMGALADAAMAAGGEVIGVIPEALMKRELGHGGLSKLHLVRTMHERKALMADLADAFIALPGGLGTFEELFEVLTWAQLGLHAKPCGLLNLDGFYEPLLRLLDHGVQQGFIKPAQRGGLVVADSVTGLIEQMAAAADARRTRRRQDG